jgi:hypothetical protein
LGGSKCCLGTEIIKYFAKNYKIRDNFWKRTFIAIKISSSSQIEYSKLQLTTTKKPKN